MTTIACSLREIAGDSAVTYDDIGIGTGQYPSKKLHHVGKSIYGERGESTAEVPILLEWIGGGFRAERPQLSKHADFYLLELSPEGIFLWSHHCVREPVLLPMFAIGSGGKVALYCMQELGMSPPEAVREACKVDHFSKGPIYTASLSAPEVTLWVPPKHAKIKE